MKNSVKLLGCVFFVGLATVLVSCGGGGDDGGGGVFHCTYDKTTYPCYGSSYSEYSLCAQEDAANIRDDWTPEYYCSQVYGGNSISCSSSCCVDVYYSNTTYGTGACPASLTNNLTNNSSNLTYKLSWSGYADLNLTALTPGKNGISAESGVVDGCQHGGNNYGIEENNSEEIICGPDANLDGEYVLTATSTSGETIQYTLEVISGDQVIQSYEGSLDPTQPEAIIHAGL